MGDGERNAVVDSMEDNINEIWNSHLYNSCDRNSPRRQKSKSRLIPLQDSTVKLV
jgi:hypothetical protein